VMAQLGHTDPKFTLRVYTHIMRRGPAERAQLKALVEGMNPDRLPCSGGARQRLTSSLSLHPSIGGKP
jgi:hypothetical protein